MRRSWRWVVALCSCASAAHAQGTPQEGSLVAVDAEDLILDVGSTRGARDGDIVDLWRPLRVKHPVTGKLIVDRFRIGQLRLVQVRPTIALARPDGTLARPAAASDVVIFTPKNAPAPVAPPLPGPALKAPAALPKNVSVAVRESPNESSDPKSKELSDLFDALRGAPIALRIQRYEAFARADPNGRFASVLIEESQALRRLRASHLESTAANEAQGGVWFTPPEKAASGAALDVAFQLDGAYSGAVLYTRKTGAPAYDMQPMHPAGRGFWASTLAADKVQGPALDYFIEAMPEKGSAVSPVGTAQTPKTITTENVAHAWVPAIEGKSAAMFTDYASFNARRKNDYFWQTEGVFGARLGDEGLRAVRSGFGVYRGLGGTLREIDELGLPAREVGLTYGYLEAEFGFTPTFGVATRAIIGLREGGISGGAQGFFRVGSDKKTNLLFGGEFLGGIGLRGITQLEWNTLRRFPIVLRTEITNQPGGVASEVLTSSAASTGQGEVGARAIVQVGYRLVPGLVVAARVSYQGRTINHAGPGAGAGATYQW